MLSSLLCLIAFFSRIPLRECEDYSVRLTKALYLLPIVGGFLCCLSALFFVLVWYISDNFVVAILLMMALHTWITRALHEDGLCDCVDGFSSYKSIEQRLTIMKEPQIGSFAIIVMFFVLMLRFVSLVNGYNDHNSFFDILQIILVWIGAGVLAKTCIVFVAYWLPPAKNSGLGLLMINVDLTMMFKTCFICAMCFLLLLVMGMHVGTIFLGVGLSFICVFYFMLLTQNKIGGFTGDVFGAVEQIAFTAFIVIAFL